MQPVLPTQTDAEVVVTPKVFISYSWSSPEHKERVRLWAEQLLANGVEVVMDIYDFKEGHDKFHFMELMVSDPAITHVLVMCDRAYAEKADAKKAGVGTESQIISGEVYAKVQQSKFIPIICEVSDSGEPHLPIFLKNRKWVDFSSLESSNENWESLIRLLYGKPLHEKPQLGKAPTYLTATSGSPPDPATSKFATFKHALLAGSKNLPLYRTEFLSACTAYAEGLRVRVDPGLDYPSLAQKILDDSGRLKNVRNHIVDWVLLESGPTPSTEFEETLFDFLETLRELKARPEPLSSWQASWLEAHSVFVYETFLYIVAALIKTKSYSLLQQVFTTHYLVPKSERYSTSIYEPYTCFYGYSEALEQVLGTPGRRLHSPAAALIKRQADRTDIPFHSVIEAELLVLLMTFVMPDKTWYPQTLHYQANFDFPFFFRATQHKHFVKLALITGISDADSLREKVKAGMERLGVSQWPGFSMLNRSFWSCMNMDKLDTL